MHEIFLNAETLFHIGNFPFTNTLLLTFLVVGLLLVGSYLLTRRYGLVPNGAQNLVEVVYEQVVNLLDSVLGNRRASEKYLPFVASIFIFVLLCNWFGILPGVGSVGFYDEEHHAFMPLLRSPASDLNFTLALSLVTVVMVNIFGITAIGISKYASKFFNFSSPIKFYVGVLELVSEIGRLISFAFRLFGNVFAGEVLLLVIAFLVPFAAPIPFFLLEIFVGFIQAFVFAMLALVFIAIAIVDHEDEHHARVEPITNIKPI